ncbi:pilus assembly protein PilZ [Vibrio navarrensis]|uniref:PilZ domain-containing protein n=1 Tax=Vibrio navarrensis TaxID=29495 RepID=UPI00052BF23A|nr:PilZ domain-containing protein [Vibrio navarrensis]KGK22603.1 pilus assembly protein PilZ [Vibrio navarrensis]
MEQAEILSIAERLIPLYNTEDFDFVLSQLTEGESPSAKLLVKMELNRIMAPCKKSIDLRGRVQGECREYELDGLKHWLDDVAFNAYHKNTKKFGRYTEGVWEALSNTRNSFRALGKNTQQPEGLGLTDPASPYEAEAIYLGYDLKRQEKRLRVQSQVEIKLAKGQVLHGVSVDLSSSGAKFKVPSAFSYNLGEIIQVSFSELAKTSKVANIDKKLEYRVLAVEDSYENDAVKFLRCLRLTETNIIARVIDESLSNSAKRARHDNQDKIIRSRTRGYEHIYLKHTCNLPLFFQGSELKLAMMTPNNAPIWNYWHDERKQQVFGTLFNPQRMEMLIKAGVKGTSNVIYSFTHEHENKIFFYSMLMPEATREQRQLFWHLGARRSSWRAFRISIFELSDKEKQQLASFSSELADASTALTHCGILQEIADDSVGDDYLFTEKPRIPASTLNTFRHPRKIVGAPKGIFFDAKSRRKEPRYSFQSPLLLTKSDGSQAQGNTLDLSKRGLSLQLNAPLALIAGEEVEVNYLELQLYDKKLPLDKVPYRVIRVSPDGQQVQLVIDENSQTIKTIAFFNSIIEHNQDKLIAQQEILPSNELLESLHSILLSKMVSTPIFISKTPSGYRTKAIGVNFPLEKHLMLLAKLGHKENLSLEPLYKGRSNTLIANPTKRIDGAEPVHHEIYIAVTKFGDKIKAVQTKAPIEFDSVKERIQFVKKAKMSGEFYVLRLSTAPIFSPMTSLLQKDLNDLAHLSMHQASKLEKELSTLMGYCEMEEITEEILIRLELSD